MIYNPLTVALHFNNAEAPQVQLGPLTAGRLHDTWTLELADGQLELVTVFLSPVQVKLLAEKFTSGAEMIGRDRLKLPTSDEPAITFDQARLLLMEMGYNAEEAVERLRYLTQKVR